MASLNLFGKYNYMYDRHQVSFLIPLLLDPFTLTIQTRHEVSAVLLPVDLPLTVTSAESEFHSGIDLA